MSKALDKYEELVEAVSSALDNCHYFLAGCSTKEKNEYTRALTLIKELVIHLRDIKDDLMSDPLIGDQVSTFLPSFETELFGILSVGKAYLGNIMERDEYLATSDELRLKIEKMRDDFEESIAGEVNKLYDIMEEANEEVKEDANRESKEPLFSVESTPEEDQNLKPLVSVDLTGEFDDWENITMEQVLELQRILQEEKRIGEQLKINKEKLRNALMENEKKKRMIKQDYEDTTVGILDYKIELNVLVRVEKKAKDRIEEYGLKIQEISKHIISLRSRLTSEDEMSDTLSLEENMNRLIAENKELRNKLNNLAGEIETTFTKAGALSKTLVFDTDSSEILDLKRQTDELLDVMSDLKLEVSTVEEKVSEYDEVISHLDKELKTTTSEMRAAQHRIPSSFIEELQQFTHNAEIIWDNLYTITSI